MSAARKAGAKGGAEPWGWARQPIVPVTTWLTTAADPQVVAALVDWYEEHGRHLPWRSSGAFHPWQVLVIEILLQQTQAPRVAAFIPAFFDRYPTLSRLRACGESAIAEALRPLGLHRRRAARLCALAVRLEELGGRVPRHRAELEALPGVGEYVASA